MEKITNEMAVCNDIVKEISKELDEYVKKKAIDNYVISCGIKTPSWDGGEDAHSGASTYGNAETISVGIAHIVLDVARKNHIPPMAVMMGIWDIMGAIEQGAGYSAER